MARRTGGSAIVTELQALVSPGAADVIRRRVAADEQVLGLRMRDVFDTAKAHRDASLDTVDELLNHPGYEPRLTGFCILDFQVRRRLTEAALRDRYDLYLRRHDRITSWDMVDRAAPRVVGGYLAGRDLAPLRQLAESDEPLRRRTAITAPLFYTRAGSLEDLAGGFVIAARLADDPEPIVSNAVGIFLKHAGTRTADDLRAFLAEHAHRMPRPALRLSIEKLPAAERTAILRG